VVFENYGDLSHGTKRLRNERSVEIKRFQLQGDLYFLSFLINALKLSDEFIALTNAHHASLLLISLIQP
jgi:hypothetical protein